MKENQVLLADATVKQTTERPAQDTVQCSASRAVGLTWNDRATFGTPSGSAVPFNDERRRPCVTALVTHRMIVIFPHSIRTDDICELVSYPDSGVRSCHSLQNFGSVVSPAVVLIWRVGRWPQGLSVKVETTSVGTYKLTRRPPQIVHVLTDGEVDDLLDLSTVLDVVEDALVRQGRGDVERPDRPHFPVGMERSDDDDPLGTGLVMPAYIHGAEFFATKLVGIHEDNPARGIPTVNATIALQAAETGLPEAYMAGTRITNARTGCIGGLAARTLAVDSPIVLGIIGAGTQARWQARAIDAAVEVDSIRVFSPSASKVACAGDLQGELGVEATPVDGPADAVSGADVIVTATTSTEPVFPADALEPGSLVVAVGAYTSDMQELEPGVFDHAERVFADVPEEVGEIGDVLATDMAVDDMVELAAVFEGRAGRESPTDVLVVESVGTAVLDAAVSEHVLTLARERDVGSVLSL